ncbi:MAG: pyruvate kinase [Candidatus Nanoarchaeia archaeon]|nr:pyruvate kinase [Candidatus Nanoarchaeia archaeon]
MVGIIATIGPSSMDLRILKKMADAGMTIGRVNMKYASADELISIKNKLDELGVKLLVDILNISQFKIIKNIDFDYIALSFTESGEQINKLRKLMKTKKAIIIAKIENRKGVKKMKSIINASDGLMVARGDLGKNIRLEELPICQKIIIKDCNKKGKYVITATEMLLSMVNSRTPTKAEASDVVNAVIDGSNAVMLSEETAIGKYPVYAVRIMRRLIKSAQKYLRRK